MLEMSYTNQYKELLNQKFQGIFGQNVADRNNNISLD